METRVHRAPTMVPKRSKKRRRIFSLKGLFFLIGIFILAYLALFLLVVPERPDHRFFAGDTPLVIAHRGGASLAPENTLIAFDKARSIGVDVLEMDIQLTKDGHLVVIHDETIDRTTNGQGRVDEMTLEELRSWDAAHRFQDIRGNYIYRGQGVQIPLLEEIFEQFGTMRMNIEMKVPAAQEDYERMAQRLWELITAYGVEDRVLIASFSDKLMDQFTNLAQGRVAISAGKQEVTKFVLYHKLFLNRLYKPRADAIQIPLQSGAFNLKEQRIIRGAQALNIHVHYWTINDEQTMRELLDRGVDGIITDRPDLLLRVLRERKGE